MDRKKTEVLSELDGQIDNIIRDNTKKLVKAGVEPDDIDEFYGYVRGGEFHRYLGFKEMIATGSEPR